MVDIDSLTDEERAELARKLTVVDGGNAFDRYKDVVVDGHVITVDMERLTSWRAMSLMARMQDPRADERDRMFSAVTFMEYAMGGSIGAVLEACGGEDANAVTVMDFISRVLTEAAPKN